MLTSRRSRGRIAANVHSVMSDLARGSSALFSKKKKIHQQIPQMKNFIRCAVLRPPHALAAFGG